jgi:hypothetical protein
VEPDWQKVRIPRPFYFLYYLVRPARFIMERSSNPGLVNFDQDRVGAEPKPSSKAG